VHQGDVAAEDCCKSIVVLVVSSLGIDSSKYTQSKIKCIKRELAKQLNLNQLVSIFRLNFLCNYKKIFWLNSEMLKNMGKINSKVWQCTYRN